MQLKHSKQRDSILEFLAARKDHPTADVVYMNVREQLPNISLGTVYRNLTLLSDLGEILRLRVGDGTDHFDADTSPHNHFVCKEVFFYHDNFIALHIHRVAAYSYFS